MDEVKLQEGEFVLNKLTQEVTMINSTGTYSNMVYKKLDVIDGFLMEDNMILFPIVCLN